MGSLSIAFGGIGPRRLDAGTGAEATKSLRDRRGQVQSDDVPESAGEVACAAEAGGEHLAAEPSGEGTHLATS